MHFQIFLVCHSHWLKETLIKPVRFKKNIFIFKDWTPFKTKEKRGFRGGSDENLFWLAFLPSIKGRLWFLPPEAITSIITLVDHMTSLNFGRKNCLSILQSTTKDYTFLERTGSEHVFALIRGLFITISDINTFDNQEKTYPTPRHFPALFIVISLQKTIKDWWFGFCWNYIISSKFLWLTSFSGILKLILAWSVIKSFLICLEKTHTFLINSV